MTTLDRTDLAPNPATPDPAPTPAPALRQIGALARAEWTLLLRNKVAAINCFALPLVCAVFFLGVAPDALGLGVLVPTIVLGTALLFVVYYTLVTALVARRESLLLKRLRAGEASDGVILAGLSAPFVAVTLGQAVLAAAAATVLFDLPLHPRMLLFLLGALAACVTWVMLAIASTPMTKSVEHAQITTLPVIMVPLLLSGLSIPLAVMPEPLRTVAQLTPLTPVTELSTLAFAGTDLDGRALGGAQVLLAAVRPLLVLVAWALVSTWVAKRTMRWEARS